MTNSAAHWDNIFNAKRDAELGWFERDLEQTLKYVRCANLHDGACIFIPGAGTSHLADRLLDMNHRLVLNDLSAVALQRAKIRLGNKPIEYLCADIAQAFNKSVDVDFWLDRAVLHFLTQPDDIRGYFNNVRHCVRPGGYVLLAQFAKGGASKCAGLPLKQYDIADMQTGLGGEFELVSHEAFTFINPLGQHRPYTYGLFQRTGN